MEFKKLTPNNTLAIQGWMRTQLDLKGNELIVYALIYSFSQDEESEFYGSRTYINEWLGTTLPTVDKALEGLLEKNLIAKIESTINGKQHHYKVNLEVVKNLYGGCKETLQGCKETLQVYNNKDKNKEIILSYGFGEDLNEAIFLWLQYKAEKNNRYKETGLKGLLNDFKKEIATRGEQGIIDGINMSISRNYSGVFYQNNYSYGSAKNKASDTPRKTTIDKDGVFHI